jgi:hypothetical protein
MIIRFVFRLYSLYLSAQLPLPLNWRGGTTRGGACGSIGVNAGNLTGGDSRMMARLTTLPDALRGGA